MLEQALKYAMRGKPVFPCGPDKTPSTPHGFQDATTDQDQIRAWWAKYPGALIGMPTGELSGFTVLDVDVDPTKAIDGDYTLHELERKHRKLPDTLAVLTPRGGRHVYFNYVPGIRSSASKLGPGLDIRGEGGYVIVPPSVVLNGRSYEWEGSNPNKTADMPDWMVEVLLQQAKQHQYTAKSNGPIMEGGRNAHLTSLAGSMRRRGMSVPAMVAALMAENAERCHPPLHDGEVMAIATSVGRYKPHADNDVDNPTTNPASVTTGSPAHIPTPHGILLLPSDHYSYTDAARGIFTEFAKTNNLFVRGGNVVELTETDQGGELSILRPSAFQSRLDGMESRVMTHIMVDGKLALKPKRCSKQNAEVLLEAKEAKELLPKIALLSAAPVMIEHNGESHVLDRGYHRECGGIFVTGRQSSSDVPLDQAVRDLRSLLCDFDFQTPSDESRALAMQVTPALKMGGFFKNPTPADVAEADQSQSGKTYRQAVTRAIYGERAYAVTRREGGVGSLDESISSALVSGRAFIAMDNLRGRLDSQFLEAVITWPEPVPARVPHRGEVKVDARRVTFSMTSNGAETTRDLANRSCIVRIRKQPRNYQWHSWPEGSLLEHVEANQSRYLGCVHAVVREWIRKGKPKTQECRHDMREWASSLDWIVRHIFGVAPLLDGHLEAQERVSNPALVWLRAVCITAEQEGLLDRTLSASSIWDLTQDQGIDLPRSRGEMDELAGRRYVGQLMGKVFRDAEGNTVEADGYFVTRSEFQEWDERHRKERTTKRYKITRIFNEKKSVPSAPYAPCGHNFDENAGNLRKFSVQGAQGAGFSPCRKA